MKRSLAIAVVCFLAALCAVPAMAARVNREKDAIRITEIPVFGDPAKAAGISLEYDVHWEGKLLWNTEYILGGEKDAESSFSFSSDQTIWQRSGKDNLDAFGTGSWGASADNGLNLDDVYLSRAVKDVASRTQPGEIHHSEEIDLADYYEYYPLYFLIHSESRNVYYSSQHLFEEDGMDILAKHMAIPIAPGERLILTVGKNAEGNCIDITCNPAEGTVGRGIAFVGTFGESGLYMSYRIEDQKAGDPSVEGARCGIFYIPYMEEPDGTNRSIPRNFRKTLDGAGCRKVWKAERDGLSVKELILDETKGILYLVGADEAAYYLYTFQTVGEELQLLQILPVMEMGENEENGGEAWAGMRVEEDGVLLAWERGSFVFLTEENGEYTLFCRSELSGISPTGDHEPVSVFPWEYTCVFDGERLALAAFDTWHGVNAWVGIYKEEGMVYLGRYEHSGSLELRADHTGDIRPQGNLNGRAPRAEQPLKIRILR